MIYVTTEEESGQIFFQHLVYEFLKKSKSKVQIEFATGIDNLLARTFPDACKLLGNTYEKAIAIFDRDKIHEAHGSKTRIQRLQEILNQHPKAGGFQVRENLENLIETCLSTKKRRNFREISTRKSKVVGVQWALKQNLDKKKLKSRIVDLERSLNCQLIRDFR